ncbi:Proteasome subunit beta type-5 [Perkinsus chesapeaki]|uniref:proteasome endopeptidase complex n=1 Tax=Perkinsus chesapeaki TaxID=330153 RepID=A0A7J6LYG0_PERCH|nr:Proteasome subunit beta type-5 [Perkinsus chesapeaki]
MSVIAPVKFTLPGRNRVDEEEEEQQACGLAEMDRFALAPVAQPQNFCTDIKARSGRLMNFNKGKLLAKVPGKVGATRYHYTWASMGSYVSSQTVRKVLHITDRLIGTMAGGAADCQFWERHLGRLCKLYELRNNQRVTTAAASKMLANIMYSYKGYGLSCGTMIAGYDANTGPALYMVDDQGTRIKNYMFSVGSGSTYAYGILDAGYKHDMLLKDAVELAKHAIYHATNKDGASGGYVRVYHVHKDGWTIIEDGQDVMELHYKYAAEKGMSGIGDEA